MLPGRTYTGFDFAWMAWRRRWVIVVPLILGAYAALVVSSRLQDMYQSEMLIQVVPQRVPDAYVRSTVTMRTQDRVNTLTQQVMSRTEIERLIEQMNLYPDARARLPMQDVVERMRGSIKVEVAQSQNTRDADAFYVRFTYPDRDIVTRVTERLGVLFIDMNTRDRGDLAQATNNFLQSQLAGARGKLEEQEGKLEQFRQQNAGRLPSQLDLNMQAINRTQLEVQALVESLARDRDRKLMLERLYNDAQVESMVAAPLTVQVQAGQFQKADPTGPSSLNTAQQLVVARETLARLELRLRPEHPDIVRSKRQIQDLEKRASEEASVEPASGPPPAPSTVTTPEQTARRERLRQMLAEIESLERQIAFKEAAEQRLRATMTEYQRRIEQAPGLESEWIALTRDYDTQQSTYKNLLTKSGESQIATELEKRQIGEQFRILDPARPPVRPIGVERLWVNGMGAAAGLALGLALAALLEFRDTTFRSADDVLDALKLPVLALVPYVANDIERRRQRWYHLLTSGVVAVFVIAGGYIFWAMGLWRYIR